jgi:flagellin
MEMADRNTWDGSSLLETTDAALQSIQDMVHRMRELAVAAANDVYTEEDRENSMQEIRALMEEINDVTRKVEFNNIRLLNGEVSNLRIQVGGRKGMSIPVSIPSFTTDALQLTNRPVFFREDPAGLTTEEREDPLNWTITPNRWPIDDGSADAGAGLRELPVFFATDPAGHPTSWLEDPANWTFRETAWAAGFDQAAWDCEVSEIHSDTGTGTAVGQWAIQATDEALERISRNRAHIGAYVNRFEYTSLSLQSAIEATSRSLSRIFDTDMAFEMMELSKNNIMNQAGMAVMAQTNARPQQILQLIG